MSNNIPNNIPNNNALNENISIINNKVNTNEGKVLSENEKSEIINLVKKGATSFHCSEEIWNDPLGISNDLNQKQVNDLRKGWDLLIDIDSPYLDLSKIAFTCNFIYF